MSEMTYEQEMTAQENSGMDSALSFMVQDDASAEWCLKKIREQRQSVETWRQHYAGQMKKVEETAAASISYFESLLADYFESVPHKKTKTQETYSLPGGKLILKKQQPKFDQDDAQLVPWLKENGLDALVKVKESANWAELKKTVTVTADGEHVATQEGEIVPGVTVTQRPDVFSVEVEE